MTQTPPCHPTFRRLAQAAILVGQLKQDYISSEFELDDDQWRFASTSRSMQSFVMSFLAEEERDLGVSCDAIAISLR